MVTPVTYYVVRRQESGQNSVQLIDTVVLLCTLHTLVASLVHRVPVTCLSTSGCSGRWFSTLVGRGEYTSDWIITTLLKRTPGYPLVSFPWGAALVFLDVPTVVTGSYSLW